MQLQLYCSVAIKSFLQASCLHFVILYGSIGVIEYQVAEVEGMFLSMQNEFAFWMIIRSMQWWWKVGILASWRNRQQLKRLMLHNCTSWWSICWLAKLVVSFCCFHVLTSSQDWSGAGFVGGLTRLFGHLQVKRRKQEAVVVPQLCLLLT